MTNAKVAFKILDDNESVPKTTNLSNVILSSMSKWRTSDKRICSLQEETWQRPLTQWSIPSLYLVKRFVFLSLLPCWMTFKWNLAMSWTLTSLHWSWSWYGLPLGPSLEMTKARRKFFFLALYCLKYRDAAFRKHLDECISGISYKPCIADPYFWEKARSEGRWRWVLLVHPLLCRWNPGFPTRCQAWFRPHWSVHEVERGFCWRPWYLLGNKIEEGLNLQRCLVLVSQPIKIHTGGCTKLSESPEAELLWYI